MPRALASSIARRSAPSHWGDSASSTTTQPSVAWSGSWARTIATGQCAELANAAAVDPIRPLLLCARPIEPTHSMAAHLEACLKAATGSVLQDLDFDLHRLAGRFDRHERVSDGDLCGREVARGILAVRPGRFRGDRVHKAQRDIATHRLVDGPQSGIQRRSRAVDADNHRRRWDWCAPMLGSDPASCVLVGESSPSVDSSDLTSKTSSIGRRGVGGTTSSTAGTAPTRISTCGVVVCSISAGRTCRLAGSSVMWVSVQVARPAIVASSNTAESISPHRSTLARFVVCVDSTTILE